MKKNLLTVVVSALLAAIFVLILFVFQVRQSEVAVVTRFGRPVRTQTEPGAFFRLPPGIESVYKLDQRIQSLEDPFTETLTADNNNLLTTVYVGWRISDAAAFFPKRRERNSQRSISPSIRSRGPISVRSAPTTLLPCLQPPNAAACYTRRIFIWTRSSSALRAAAQSI